MNACVLLPWLISGRSLLSSAIVRWSERREALDQARPTCCPHRTLRPRLGVAHGHGRQNRPRFPKCVPAGSGQATRTCPPDRCRTPTNRCSAGRDRHLANLDATRCGAALVGDRGLHTEDVVIAPSQVPGEREAGGKDLVLKGVSSMRPVSFTRGVDAHAGRSGGWSSDERGGTLRVSRPSVARFT